MHLGDAVVCFAIGASGVPLHLAVRCSAGINERLFVRVFVSQFLGDCSFIGGQRISLRSLCGIFHCCRIRDLERLRSIEVFFHVIQAKSLVRVPLLPPTPWLQAPVLCQSRGTLSNRQLRLTLADFHSRPANSSESQLPTAKNRSAPHTTLHSYTPNHTSQTCRKNNSCYPDIEHRAC